ncbi:leucine-rich repeat domain-containing protein [Luteirhabdus pelagi]|uniref:leucine-rich repeat domain-containing protein n=1 Tax=Luteirhabdus pelagi TaxID=2792783 RepID=UPI0019395C83|nr:leucine-rich repeat domain-containing protein [Luteirhabdus pelagi]
MRNITFIIAVLLISTVTCIGQNKVIDSLSLKGIKEIPNEIFENDNLIYLSVFGQDCDIRPKECFAIDKLPPEIGKLVNLEELRLTLNYIQKLPNEILNLRKLRILDLTENQHFSDLETISKMHWLEEFYCFGCYISDNEIEKLRKKLPNCKILIE